MGVQWRLRISRPTKYWLNCVPSEVHDYGRASSSQCRPSSLIKIMRDVKEDDYFKPHSLRKEIMIGYAKVKVKEASLVKALGPDANVSTSLDDSRS